jgi:hypothetical protein
MNVRTIQVPQSGTTRALSDFLPTASSAGPAGLIPTDRFTRSAAGDKVKQAVVIGGASLIGAALGAYAGLGTGVLAGLAGTVAGASGGSTLGGYLPGGHVKLGALGGAIAGTLVGASVSHPAAAVVMGLAGATLPVAVLFGIFGGAE